MELNFELVIELDSESESERLPAAKGVADRLETIFI